MIRTEIDAALAAANPLTDEAAAALPLLDAERELVERIGAMPVRPRRRPTSARRPRRRRLTLALAVTAAVAAVLAVLPFSGGGGGPAPAFAASLVRFANHSPLVLLRLPGWHVVYTLERPGGYGEMHFARGAADANGNPRGASFHDEASLAGRVASLTWYPATRAVGTFIAGGHETAATGLGVTARRWVLEGAGRGWVDVSAFFIFRGREVDFRATVTDVATFRDELRALTAVDPTTWLRAMPPSVVETAESGEVIHHMLKGIPLPAGFEAARIRGARLVQNRYDLGAAVTGTVACMWIADWNRARADGDEAMVRRAIAAMATSTHWPILREMARQGAWSQVLIGYAKAMRRGAIAEGKILPLAAAVKTGLGCNELGVSFGTGRQRQTRTP